MINNRSSIEEMGKKAASVGRTAMKIGEYI